MAYEFKLPDIGEGIHEAEIVKLHVKEGDDVQEDDVFAEVETDKAVVEIPVPINGKVSTLNIQEGDTVEVGSVVATFATDEDPEEASEDARAAAEEPDAKREDQETVEQTPRAVRQPAAELEKSARHAFCAQTRPGIGC